MIQGRRPRSAGRETLEETGWQAGELTKLTSYRPHNGTSDAHFHLYRTSSAEYVGEPSDPDEAERVEWVPWPRLRDEMHAGRINDGLSLTALLWCAAFS